MANPQLPEKLRSLLQRPFDNGLFAGWSGSLVAIKANIKLDISALIPSPTEFSVRQI
jgi:hypothetical protein